MNLISALTRRTAAATDPAGSGGLPGYIPVPVSPMRAAFGPVLSLVNPDPPITVVKRLLQAFAVSMIGLLLFAIPCAAFAVVYDEMGGAPTAGTAPQVPGVRPETAQPVTPSELPLADPRG